MWKVPLCSEGRGRSSDLAQSWASERTLEARCVLLEPDPGPLRDPEEPLIDPEEPLRDPEEPLIDPGPLRDPEEPLIDPGPLRDPCRLVPLSRLALAS
ncbi:unnamed protein product [Gadus morhua 'NCC']